MNTLWNTIKETLIDLLQTMGWAWWVEIITEQPNCTYYFGPFLSRHEAQAAEAGYGEDLWQEGVENMSVQIKRCQPAEVTLPGDTEGRFTSPLPKISSPSIGNLFRRKQIFQ
jgi:Domain of unknown function (DUF1816)